MQEVLSCQRKMELGLAAGVAPERAEEEVVVGEEVAVEWEEPGPVLGLAGTVSVPVVGPRPRIKRDRHARASNAPSAARP